MLKSIYFLCFCVAVLKAAPYDGIRASCGYDSCPSYDPDKLNVHILAHSHDDVGWLKTVDQYYYGSKNQIQHAGVQYIITTVIQALKDNPERKFIQVETAFFHKWWNFQNEEVKESVRRLVENGQLEFIGGAWSMNDEATTHYHAIIDQFTFGLGILDDLFGTCGRPKIGWQIDPFGHSKGMGYIFSEMGYDGLLFGRLDYRDKEKRMESRTSELLWRNSASDLFVSVLYNLYMTPDYFCFDVECPDEPIVDDPRSHIYNYDKRIREFAQVLEEQKLHYPTNNVLMTMGGDFHFQDAEYNFGNLDKLIKGFNDFGQTVDGQNVSIYYSTPSCYVKAVNEAAKIHNVAFTLKEDDFFPYASDPHTYWTGYFSSRPTSKRFERQGLNMLQILKQLAAANYDKGINRDAIFKMEDAMGIMQHHDAITGTEKQHVADDYSKTMHEAIEAATDEISRLISVSVDYEYDLDFQNCVLRNMSVCDQTVSKDTFVVSVYNPLSRSVDKHVNLPVRLGKYEVITEDSRIVPSQISPVIYSFGDDEGEYVHGSHELVFYAENLPAMGFKLYYVQRISDAPEIEPTNTQILGTGDIRVTLDNSGLLESINLNQQTLNIKQEFFYYKSAAGDNSAPEKRASGAYIFRPESPDAVLVPITDFRVFTGELYDEVQQIFEETIKQTIRVYKNVQHVEFDWIVGPIYVEDDIGKEAITRFKTDIDSKDVFYTDANGKEMIERIRDYRATFNYTNEEPVSGNYYPVTTKISIRDENTELGLFTDRAQGGSSLRSGEVELMLHRRLLHDDDKGVNEALNDDKIARGSISLVLTGDQFTNVDYAKRVEQEKSGLAAWSFIADRTLMVEEFLGISNQISFIEETGIPENIQILTYQPHPIKDDYFIVRLEHVYGTESIDINLPEVFPHLQISSISETTLDGHQPIENTFNFEWNLVQESKPNSGIVQLYNSVQLEPNQIRTFVIYIGDGNEDNRSPNFRAAYKLLSIICLLYLFN